VKAFFHKRGELSFITICIQGFMRPELKQQLENELSKIKHKNFRAWSIAFLTLVIFLWFIVGLSSKSSVPVNGVAISQHASFREDGNKIYHG
jgi:hypothetical protein|tara:strand:+ start:273 stop:548 length:276 start_codon:yes stop_codon:yes gene_type:complete